MADVAEGAQPVDTLPKPGRVNEVCREWLVKEDGALAHRLQSEEIEHHLSGNRWRNAVVREDFPRARDEQRREQELAEEARRRQALEQEEYDARVAAELAERMEREEAARRAALETQDQHVAWRLQERERLRLEQARVPDPDPNCVGLPPPPDDLSARMRVLRIQGAGRAENPPPRSQRGLRASTEHLEDVDAIEDYVEEEEETGAAEVLDEEEARRIQEEKDAELARLLQEREAAEADPRRQLSDLDRDRLMAIEAQDRELARLLQERERAKARRAKERARQRAALKRRQQLAAEADAILPAPAPPSPSPPPLPAVRPTDLDVSPVYGHPGTRPDSGMHSGYRYPPEEETAALGYAGSPNNVSPTNIAAAIDPTYRRGSAHSPSFTECVDLESPPSPALPYMPIQGQRRCPPQPDKRAGRKEQQAGKRDACRQQ